MKENNTDYITSKIELSLLGAELYQKKGRLSMGISLIPAK